MRKTVYGSWSTLFASTKISINNFHVVSIWCRIRQNSKNPEKIGKIWFKHEILGKSEFHGICGNENR